MSERKSIRTTYYEKTEEQRKRYMYGAQYRIRRDKDELLMQMMTIVDAVVENYKEDFFVHDVSIIKENPEDPFLWFVRDNGTNLVNLAIEEVTPANEWIPEDYVNAIMGNFGKKLQGIYHFDGLRLKKINKDQMRAIMTKKKLKLGVA